MPQVNLMDTEDEWTTKPPPSLQPKANKSKIARMWSEFNALSQEEVLEVLSNKATETESGFSNA